MAQRRVPTQKRSKEKFDLILATAKSLVGEHGNDAVSMREIAKQAGLPISSIYQYFPDKNAILAAIMQGYFDGIRELIKAFLLDCESLDDLCQGLMAGVDTFYSMFKQEPTLAVLWAGMQANQELKQLDAQDSHINANLIAEKISEILPSKDRQEIFSAALLLLHTLGMTARLALDESDDGAKAIIAEFKTLALLRVKALAE